MRVQNIQKNDYFYKFSLKILHAIMDAPPTNFHRKYEWKLKKSIIEKIISCGGSIFGGAVRDMYRHMMHESLYVSKHRKSVNPLGIRLMYENYDDVTYMSDTLGRLDIPVDIDAYIDSTNVKILFDALREMKFNVVKQFQRDASGYFMFSKYINNSVIHYNYTISSPFGYEVLRSIRNALPESIKNMPQMHSVLMNFMVDFNKIHIPVIQLDLMVIDKEVYGEATHTHIEAPFGYLDFECNGLIMDATGIRLSKHIKEDITNPIQRHIELTRILDDIMHTKAVMNQGVNLERTNKMLDKKWTITSENVLLVKDSYTQDTSSTSGGHCIICHDDCTDSHYKLKCCDARYHGKCLKTCWINPTLHSISNSGKCPMCRIKLHNIHTDSIYLVSLIE